MAMRIVIDAACFISGKAYALGDVVEVDPGTATALIQMRRASLAPAAAQEPAPVPAPPVRRSTRKPAPPKED